MIGFLNENDQRETLEQIIHAVIDSAPEVKERKIAIWRRHTEDILKGVLESEYIELYREYYKKLKALGFNFESLKEDAVSN